jgi:hypothetical protein
MPKDLIISCAGLRRVPDWLPWADQPPLLLEWPGQVGGGGHASWSEPARRLRDQDGAILPNLCSRYRQFLGGDLGDMGRIAVVGFSAGSNSGVRELLRNAYDRARIDFVAAVDGMHPMISTRRVRSSENPEDFYADWSAQMQPFAEYALLAADDQGASMVCTASQVPAVPGIAPSGMALASLYQWVALRSAATGPRMPAVFPPRDTAPALRGGEAYPTPDVVQGADRFVAMWYPGRDARAHELQAYVVAPDVLRAFLVPLWGGADPRLVGLEPEPTEPPITSGEPPTIGGLPAWTPAAIGAAATVAGALL